MSSEHPETAAAGVELVELDRKWHVELKIIARERLGLVKELCRINKEQRQLDHFSDSVYGKDLTQFADKAQDRKVHEKEEKLLKKYDFEPDPVEKMNVLSLPVIREGHESSVDGESSEGGGGGSSGGGEDLGKVLTSKDLARQRIQLKKLNTERSLADRRNKRRAFWDKSIIGEKKKDMAKQRNGFFAPGRFYGHDRGLNHGAGQLGTDNASSEEAPNKTRGPYKSPSLPALNNIHKLTTVKMRMHPSLSNKHRVESSISKSTLGRLLRWNKTHTGFSKRRDANLDCTELL
nr:hypothetical protein BaRGS_013698 [Batillaria attramentaria]